MSALGWTGTGPKAQAVEVSLYAAWYPDRESREVARARIRLEWQRELEEGLDGALDLAESRHTFTPPPPPAGIAVPSLDGPSAQPGARFPTLRGVREALRP